VHLSVEGSRQRRVSVACSHHGLLASWYAMPLLLLLLLLLLLQSR
jgi:hypothetical protein